MHREVAFCVFGYLFGAHAQAVQAGYMGRRRQPKTARPGARCTPLAGVNGSARAAGEPRQKTSTTTPQGCRQAGAEAPWSRFRHAQACRFGVGAKPVPTHSAGQNTFKD